jgi:hypothetical protein
MLHAVVEVCTSVHGIIFVDRRKFRAVEETYAHKLLPDIHSNTFKQILKLRTFSTNSLTILRGIPQFLQQFLRICSPAYFGHESVRKLGIIDCVFYVKPTRIAKGFAERYVTNSNFGIVGDLRFL